MDWVFVSAVTRLDAAHVRGEGSCRPPPFCLLDHPGRQLFELVDQLPEAFRVLEQGAVALELFKAQGPGDGLAAYLADPGRVGAMSLGGVTVAMARGGATAGRAHDQAAGQAICTRPEFGDLGGDQAVAALGLQSCFWHATLLSAEKLLFDAVADACDRGHSWEEVARWLFRDAQGVERRYATYAYWRTTRAQGG